MSQTIAIFQMNSISRNGYQFNGIVKGISRNGKQYQKALTRDCRYYQ